MNKANEENEKPEEDIEIAQRFIKKAEDSDNAELKKIIKVVAEIAICAFVFIGLVAFSIACPALAECFPLFFTLAVFSIHWLLWGNLKF